MKITIAIPNFNGQNLLRDNLPTILKAGADEILVIDDGSTDKSVDVMRSEFPEVKILINENNLGFIPSVNKLFQEAQGEVVVLLNSDVLVEKDFLENLTHHFKDKKTFAVNCHEIGGGPARAFWKTGYFEFGQENEKNEVQKSAWASGGSAAYSKVIWQKLGGFDPLFRPFYWEDVDISYRALRAGYEILWEPNSKVYHEHETTIGKLFKRRYVRWVQERNQLLFIWKNISDKKLKREHKLGLFKRLFTNPGYWVPYFWALWKIQLNHDRSVVVLGKDNQRNDLEAINYANE